MTIDVVVLVGNPKPQSRTLTVGVALAQALAGGADHRLEVIDLAEYAGELLSPDSERVAALVGAVARAQLVIVATPTYKAAYTGLLKVFLDRYGSGGLSGVIAIPVMTGADLGHSLAPSTALVPLLSELGAIVPGRGLYFVTGRMDELGEIVAAARDEYLGTLRTLGALAAALDA